MLNLRVVTQIFGQAVERDLAGFHHIRMFGEQQGHSRVLFNQNNRPTELVQFLDDLGDFLGHDRRRPERGFGQQQMLAMGRALMSGPKLLLLDEPSLGLSPIMTQEIAKIVRELHQLGRTIVLVEQNARMALRLAKHAYVMETGNIALHGLAEDLRHDPKIQQTYLGA